MKEIDGMDGASPKPKILVVGAFPKKKNIHGGFVTVCRALLQSSFAKEFSLVLIDSTQVSNPPPGILRRSVYAGRRFVLFWARLLIGKPEVALIFTSSGIGLLEKGIMGRVAQFSGIPILMFPGGGYLLKNYDQSMPMRIFSSIGLRTADRIICQGRQWQEFAVEKLGFSESDAPVVENWTATEELLQIGRDRTYRKESDEKVCVLFVGWLDREKGVLEILEAISDPSLSKMLAITFVGEGNASEQAREFVSVNDLSDAVVFRGWLQGEALLEAYAKSDVFLLPSWMEGLPNAMIEAMAAGLVPLVSAVGNVQSAVSNGDNGLLLEPQNPSSIREALREILSDFSLLEKMGKEAHVFAEENFSTEKAIGKLSAVVREVLQAKPNP